MFGIIASKIIRLWAVISFCHSSKEFDLRTLNVLINGRAYSSYTYKKLKGAFWKLLEKTFSSQINVFKIRTVLAPQATANVFVYVVSVYLKVGKKPIENKVKTLLLNLIELNRN